MWFQLKWPFWNQRVSVVGCTRQSMYACVTRVKYKRRKNWTQKYVTLNWLLCEFLCTELSVRWEKFCKKLWLYKKYMCLAMSLSYRHLIWNVDGRVCSAIQIKVPSYTGCFTTLGHSCRRWFPRVFVIKKVHINMCPILDGYGVTDVF